MKRSWSSGALYVGLSSGFGVLLVGLVGCFAPVDPPPPPRRPTADQERAMVVDSVKASGPPSQENKVLFDGAAAAALDGTFGPSLPDANRSAVSCFQSGCLVEVTYTDRCIERAAQQRLSMQPTARLRTWPGMIYHSPPTALPDGRLQVTWALLIADTTVPENHAKLDALLKPPTEPRVVFRPEVCGRASAGTVLQPGQGVTK